MKFPFSIFIVKEQSMEPAYNNGDHVLTFNWGKIESGDVVVFGQGQKVYIKRLKSVDGQMMLVSGDNVKFSAKIAPFNKNLIIGRVIFKY